MPKTANDSQPLIEQKQLLDSKQLSASEKALFAYLDEMLREGTESEAASVEPLPDPATSALAAEETIPVAAAPVVAVPVVAVAVVAAQTEPELPEPVLPAFPPPQKPVTPPVRTRPRITQDLAPVQELELPEASVAPGARLPPLAGRDNLPLTEALRNGRPAWAQSRFDALLFKVAGLKLAVPLVSLGLIHPIDKKFNALPHQTPWFVGLLRVSGGASIKVIDTAMCVMPERYTPACRDGLKYVITLHGYDWGLACHEVDKAINLDPESINWRTQRGKRPWMAGTVRDHMCALIDSAGFHSVIAAVECHNDPSKG